MVKKRELLNDVIAKKIFAEENFGIRYVAEIISYLLKLDNKDVLKNLKMIHPNISYNSNIVDSTTDLTYLYDKNYINIEINYFLGELSNIKNYAYICQLYLRDIKRSKDYKKRINKKIIQINIDGYDYFQKDEFIYKSTMREEKYNIEEKFLIEIYHINVEKLRKESYTEIAKDRLKKILYMFVCSDEEKLRKMYEGDELMGKIWNLSKQFIGSFDELLYYNEKELKKQDRELAIQEGIEQGIEQGIKKRNIEIANKLLATTDDLKYIENITGLSIKELEKLKNK